MAHLRHGRIPGCDQDTLSEPEPNRKQLKDAGELVWIGRPEFCCRDNRLSRKKRAVALLNSQTCVFKKNNTHSSWLPAVLAAPLRPWNYT